MFVQEIWLEDPEVKDWLSDTIVIFAMVPNSLALDLKLTKKTNTVNINTLAPEKTANASSSQMLSSGYTRMFLMVTIVQVVKSCNNPSSNYMHSLQVQGVIVAPLWDFSRGEFVGVVKATYFNLILRENQLKAKMCEIYHCRPKISFVEVLTVCQIPGVSLPVYATAEAYTPPTNPSYPKLQPSSLFAPQSFPKLQPLSLFAPQRGTPMYSYTADQQLQFQVNVGRTEIGILPPPSENSGLYSSWPVQINSDKFDGPKTYCHPEELKSGKARKFELPNIAVRIVDYSADQHGSRLIQQKSEDCGAEKGITVASLWERGEIVGVLTATDFILILRELARRGSNLTDEELETRSISAWEAGKIRSGRLTDGNGIVVPRHFIHVGPYDSFLKLLYIASLSGILKSICRHFRHSSSSLPILEQPLCSIPLGTWVPKIGESGGLPLAMLRPNASLNSAVALFQGGGTSSSRLSGPAINAGTFSKQEISVTTDISSITKDAMFLTSPFGRRGTVGRRNEMTFLPSSSNSSGLHSSWPVQRCSGKFDGPKTYSYHEEVESIKARKLELPDIAGCIVEFRRNDHTTDQNVSRLIQHKSENYGVEEKKASAFGEVLPDASKLITDMGLEIMLFKSSLSMEVLSKRKSLQTNLSVFAIESPDVWLLCDCLQKLQVDDQRFEDAKET